ncbi:hypothetical protein [Moraxella osloensis]|uniref:hypothetical protein n=1 Tax=Faucicola osloensis TaxID=34062 RepID=UPI001314C201|nr:hypothetical protein [Moraxella osloensis]
MQKKHRNVWGNVPADPKNAFTVRRKMGKNTVKPLDYARLNRYYNYMETRKAQFLHPTKRKKYDYPRHHRQFKQRQTDCDVN